MRINNEKISEKDWGDIDKSELGNRLAAGYEAGDVSVTVIKEAYAYVPDDAIEGGKFYHSKAKLPHHEIIGNELVLNRRGVIAAVGAISGARGGVDLPSGAIESVKRHLRRHYSDMGMEIPDALK